MIAPRPYALLAEITYRCPLHCPYCSNPTQARNDQELTTNEWTRVIREAAALGVLQIGFSGGEPLVRRDLPDLVRAAREANLYTNLITSGIGLDDDRVRALRDAGLDSVQLSFQSDTPISLTKSPALGRISTSWMLLRESAQSEFRLVSILSFTAATSIACHK